MSEQRATCWEAGYKDDHGRPFMIFGTATNECPVSLISAQSLELVQLFARTRMMKEFGASPYGGNLSRWPSKLVDAFTLLQEEHTKVENLRSSPLKTHRKSE